MKLVIDIPDSEYKRFKKYYLPSDHKMFVHEMVNRIAKGVPLEDVQAEFALAVLEKKVQVPGKEKK